MVTNGNSWVVNNGAIQFTLDRSVGKITSLVYDNQQMVGSKQFYYDIQGAFPPHPPRPPPSWRRNIFRYTTGSNSIDITAYHPATTAEPVDVTWHWILRDGDSGYSSYLTYHHTSAMADWTSNENRLGAQFYNENLFHDSSITDNFWGYQDAGVASRDPGRFITGETSDVRGIPGEYAKNYETKYDWRSTYQQSGGVTGIFKATPNMRRALTNDSFLANDYARTGH